MSIEAKSKALLTLSLLLFLSSISVRSYANLMSQQERQQFIDIQQSYHVKQEYRLINQELSEYNAKVWQFANDQERSNHLAHELTKLVTQPYVESDENNLEQVSTQINQVLKEKSELDKTIAGYGDLQQSYQTILAQYDTLDELRKRERTDLMKLYNQVLSRLKVQIANKRIREIYSGSTTCGRNDSVHQCINQIEPQIKRQIINDDLYLTSRSSFTEFNIIDANLNLNGALSYQIEYIAQAVLNPKVIQQLNKEFAFDMVTVYLKSNVPAQWFINGKQVGEGEHVSISLPTGSHGILASYQGQSQSSIEEVIAGNTYQYHIEDRAVEVETQDVSPAIKTSSNPDLTPSHQQKSDPATTPQPSPLFPSESTDVITDASSYLELDYTLILQQGDTVYHLIIDEQTAPLLHETHSQHCESMSVGRLATLEEYIDLMHNDSLDLVLSKYNFTTSNHGVVRVTDKQFIRLQKSGIGICVQSYIK
ncbi:hypothetical protein [Vibrio hippocampi]|uniref:PEGA domain-containing protein n=1 Tax=Vibrio hippocampi TaxID=654686 RepID=A0ABM8ZL40_9VIBR|nr:hypothetical protein [Vibrio hippocampi]CAH0528958.1 hypothetical protein VHP8226_02978 [Vibrio hippocampi]